jgi:GT2 family glycosyltransferase
VLSIVVPTRRPGDRPLRTLQGLAQQDIRLVSEVVIVADGLAPEAVAALGRLRVPFRFRVIDQPPRGQGAARNRGAAETDGDWILFIDDDMDLSAGFLRHIVDRSSDDVDVILPDLRIGSWVPDTLPVLVARRLERAALETRSRDPSIVFEDLVFAATAIRRITFERERGFDESFTAGGAYGNEDIELGYRLLRSGARVVRARDVIASTDFPHELSAHVRRARHVGRNDVRFARKHPGVALPLFGRKLAYSRTHRLVGTAVLRAPWIARAELLLRWPVRWWVHAYGEGPLRTRLWLVLRSIWYWSGVADAGGRTLALEAGAVVRHAAVPPSPITGSDPPEGHGPGR